MLPESAGAGSHTCNPARVAFQRRRRRSNQNQRNENFGMPPMKANQRIFFLLAAAVAGGALDVLPAAEHAPVGYTDTPMLPGGKWHVHDPNRPQPKVVAPGTFSTPETPGKPPSDAVVLFGGADLSRWRNDHAGPTRWVVKDGAMTVPPKK